MWILGFNGPSGFSARSTAEQVTDGIDGSGLTAIVTGPFLSFFSSLCFFIRVGFGVNIYKYTCIMFMYMYI